MTRLFRALAVATALLAAHAAMAQAHYDPNIAIGAKAGATLSRTNFQPSVPQNMVPGFTAGVTFRYMEETHFGIIAELNVEQRGWKEKFKDMPYRFSRRFTYLQLPVLSHIYFGRNKVRGFFNAGPAIGVMIGESTSSNFDHHNAASIPEITANYRPTDQYTLPVKYKFDYGIAAGLGMEFVAGKKHSFLLEGRFYYGLNDVFAHRKKDTFAGSGGMSVIMTLGYFYRIK